METTDKLALPYIISAQAQKHVTHNEALRLLDAIIHCSIVSQTAPLAPPSNPVHKQSYWVPVDAEGAWAGHQGDVATFVDGAWSFSTPQTGWLIWVEDEASLYVFDRQALSPLVDSTPSFEHLGINAHGDGYNRFILSSQASLFTHEGSGHRLVINKAGTFDTASMVFQTNYSGRAEFGLTGDDMWRVKVSADGANWFEALVADPANGILSAPNGIKLGGAGTALSHYDEGGFSPTLVGSNTAGNPTYTARAGVWTRCGNMVVINGYMQWSALGGLSGTVRLEGLPFTCRSGLESRFPLNPSWYDSLAMDSDVSMLGGYTEPGSNAIQLWGAKAAHEGVNLLLSDNHLSATGEIYFNCTYMSA